MRTTITLNGLDVPAFEIRGERDGPKLALIGGVHGCEYSSIAAVTRIARELDPTALAGSVTAVPVVSMESFVQRSPFVVPADGKNLNRTFPGDADGSYTERLAYDIRTKLIDPADALLDLHGGDLVEALEPFALASNPESRDLALAFGMPYLVEASSLQGMTVSAARRGVIAEAGGAGQLEPHATDMLVEGARNAMRVLGMLAGAPPAPRSRTIRRFEWLYSAQAGFWVAHHGAGAEVAKGDVLGEVRDLYGDTRETITAPDDGAILFLTTSAAVTDNGLLLGLGVR